MTSKCVVQAELGNATLASLQRFTQEVKISLNAVAAQERGSEEGTFLWHMCMQNNGKWMCREIECVAQHI